MSLMTFFALAAALFAAVSLFNGVVSMAHGGEANHRESHLLMFQRVGWQALAALFVVLTLFQNLD
jgi:hypothetical protein